MCAKVILDAIANDALIFQLSRTKPKQFTSFSSRKGVSLALRICNECVVSGFIYYPRLNANTVPSC